MVKNEETRSLAMAVNFPNGWVVQIFGQDVARTLELRSLTSDAPSKSDT